MSGAVAIHRDKLTFQNIHEFVERVVSRLQGARFASPKGDFITGKDAGLVHGCHQVGAVEIAESDSRRVDGPFRQLAGLPAQRSPRAGKAAKAGLPTMC